jgi:hypothetical protein
VTSNEVASHILFFEFLSFCDEKKKWNEREKRLQEF